MIKEMEKENNIIIIVQNYLKSNIYTILKEKEKNIILMVN